MLGARVAYVDLPGRRVLGDLGGSSPLNDGDYSHAGVDWAGSDHSVRTLGAVTPSSPRDLPRRTVLCGMVTAAVALGLGSCAGARTDVLDATMAQLVGGLDPNGHYRHPTGDERRQAQTGTDRLLRGDTAAAQQWFQPLGMDTSSAVDAATGRAYALAASHPFTDRSWGLLVIDLTPPGPHLVLEVPHPVADQNSEHIGLALFGAIPG